MSDIGYYAVRFTFYNVPSYWNKLADPKCRVGYAVGGTSVVDNSSDCPGKAIKLYTLKQAKAKVKYFSAGIDDYIGRNTDYQGHAKVELVPVSFIFGAPVEVK